MSEGKGGNLCIVDNSISSWNDLGYLKLRTEIASALDIATAFFEIGALLVPDGQWQNLNKICILMGEELTGRTKRTLVATIRLMKKIDGGIERHGGWPGAFSTGAYSAQSLKKFRQHYELVKESFRTNLFDKVATPDSNKRK